MHKIASGKCGTGRAERASTSREPPWLLWEVGRVLLDLDRKLTSAHPRLGALRTRQFVETTCTSPCYARTNPGVEE
jgi:hypothetical protein